MKKILPWLVVALVITLSSWPPSVTYSSPHILQTTFTANLGEEWTKDSLWSLVNTTAEKYNVSAVDMARTIENESGWDYKIQSKIKYTASQIQRNPHWGKVGEREKSFGLAQIHIPAGHRVPFSGGNYEKGAVVTEEMAKDPVFAVEFMAYHFSQGRKGSMWMGYNQ